MSADEKRVLVVALKSSIDGDRFPLSPRVQTLTTIQFRSGAETLSCWHQYLDECPPDKTEVLAVSIACRITVVSHR
jgi:hypothetical protein